MRRRAFILFALFLSHTLSAMPPYSLESIQEGYKITLTIPDVNLEKAVVNDKLKDGTPVNETFTRIAIPGFSINGELGEPELLMSSFQLALEDNEPVIEISGVVEENIPLVNKIYPLQPPQEYENRDVPFHYNQDAYKRSGTRSPAVRISRAYTYRGQKAVSVEFNPVQYNPVNNILTVAKSFTVTFKMTKPKVVRSFGSRVFDKQMRSMFKNLGNQGNQTPADDFNGKEKYLIIASSDYQNNADLQKFVNFRSSNCEVELVSTSDVGGSGKDDYKDYIRGKMPAYCVLVGKYQDFPTHSYNSTRSYVYYVSSSTSEPNPDIALGLFFVRKSQSLTNLVNKTISTEQNLISMPSHFVAFGGNTQQMGNLPPNHCDVIVREMYDDYLEPLGGWDITELYQVNQPRGGKDECIEALNQGVKFINYNGHGMTDGWTYGNGSWRTSSIGNVSNTYYPFVLSCSCLTGNFTSTATNGCWAEYWIGHENLASAFIGSVTNATTSMHGLNRGMYKALIQDEITQYGMAFVSAENYVYDSVSYSEELAVWQFHYFGDPALETMKSAPFLTTTSPNGGEEWEQGRSFEITWGTNVEGNVKIDLLKGGTLHTTLTSSAPAMEPFTWNIPADFPLGTDYKIKVHSLQNDTCVDESDDFFSITEMSVLAVMSPNGGEVYEKDKEYTITWNDNLPGNVKISLYKADKHTADVVASTESDGSHTWKVPQDIKTGMDYKIRVNSIDKPWLYDESDNYISIQNPLVNIPYTQDFDNFNTGVVPLGEYWEQLDDDDLDWTVQTGPTPSRIGDPPDETGAEGDHTSGNGKYLFTEASGSNNNKKMDMTTPIFNFRPVNTADLSFWYHMLSKENEMGTLHMDICADGVWDLDVITITGDQGDSWQKKSVNLDTYVGKAKLQVRFRGETGDGWQSDICIDDFEIKGTVGNKLTYRTIGHFDFRYCKSRLYFQVPANRSHVSLKLFNVQGKLIKELVNEIKNRGYYHADLNTAGYHNAAGIYLVKMEVADLKKTIKIVIK
jgi:hypothetical protein